MPTQSYTGQRRSIAGERSFRVLLVEDDEQVRDILAVYLEQDFIVEGVSSIQQARDRLKVPPAIDVIVLDPSLPNGRGLDTVRRIGEGYPMVPLVVVTGFTDPSDSELFRVGAHSVFRKPIKDGRSLSEKVLNAIDRHAGITARFIVANQFASLMNKKNEIKEAVLPPNCG